MKYFIFEHFLYIYIEVNWIINLNININYKVKTCNYFFKMFNFVVVIFVEETSFCLINYGRFYEGEGISDYILLKLSVGALQVHLLVWDIKRIILILSTTSPTVEFISLPIGVFFGWQAGVCICDARVIEPVKFLFKLDERFCSFQQVFHTTSLFSLQLLPKWVIP